MNVRKANLSLWCFGATVRIAMVSEAVPCAFHHTETVFRYLKMCKPKALMVPASGWSGSQREQDNCAVPWAKRT